MARKGQFKKGGGRVGETRRRRRSSGGAITKYRTRTITKYRTRGVVVRRARRRGYRRGYKAGVTVGKVAIAGMALGVVLSDNMGNATLKGAIAKIPGQKTFGSVAIAGLALGAVERFTGIGGRFRPWMRAAGLVGVAAAAIKLGTDNTAFKFVGDYGDEYGPDVMDVDIDE